MRAPFIFSYLEPVYLCNLATWANRKCKAYRIMPESLMTDVDRLKFKYIIVFTCKSKLTRGSAYSRRSDELVTVMSRARDVGESCMSPTLRIPKGVSPEDPEQNSPFVVYRLLNAGFNNISGRYTFICT